MTRDDHDAVVQRQFGASAENYRTSPAHARGRSLSRLVELAAPRSDWWVLDVATGAGHTAAALAPHAGTVVAGDMTRKMLDQAAMVCRENGLGNVLFVQESAQALSYRDCVFDLVTCRIAAHHFADPAVFVAESARVLKSGGLLGVVDNVSPEDQGDAAWINDFERRRDPSHVRCLDVSQWRDLFTRNDLVPIHEETAPKRFDFRDWMCRMNVESERIESLAERLLHAPEGVLRFWQPRNQGDRLELSLREAILVGRKGG
ncbi:MAG: class I SAM-dependent methyltransferase [Arenicellales bacterium]